MNDDMMQPTEPAQQPVSMHDTPHKHNGAWPLIAGMLGVFLVLETIAIGYGIKQMSVFKHKIDNAKTEISERVETAKEKIPPVVYVKDGKQLYAVDRISGTEKLLYTHESVRHISVLAVPQVGYEGKIFLSEFCVECDSSGFSVLSLDLTKDNPSPEKLGNFAAGSVQVSPDQTQLAYVIDAVMDADIWTTGNEIALLDLTGPDAGEAVSLAKADGFYFFASFIEGDAPGAGISGFNFTWVDRECVRAALYERPQTDILIQSGTNQYFETKTYCQQ